MSLTHQSVKLNPSDGALVRALSVASGVSGETIYRLAKELRKYAN